MFRQLYAEHPGVWSWHCMLAEAEAGNVIEVGQTALRVRGRSEDADGFSDRQAKLRPTECYVHDSPKTTTTHGKTE